MWITRTAETEIAKAVRTRPVMVLTGARQTGKTATLAHMFRDYTYVTLDLPSEAEEAEKQPRSFLARNRPPVIIDEVQYAPRLFRYLKAVVDSRRSENGQFLLTGSQKFSLMKNVSESLAGRVQILEIDTLSLGEIRRAFPEMPVEEIIVRGGFPELYAKDDLDTEEFYSSYLATYLERDVRSLANVGSLRDFQQFLRACALRSANLLNKADLARDIGIAPSTANQWLNVLEASGQVVLLEPWFSNRTKSLVKSPKLYLTDTGLLCRLLNIRTPEELMASPSAGAVWETFVFKQLRARQNNLGPHKNIYFWRDRTREVDFLMDNGGRLELFEAKWTEVPQDRDAVNLMFLRKLMPAKEVISAAVVCRAGNGYPMDNGCRVMPVSELN